MNRSFACLRARGFRAMAAAMLALGGLPALALTVATNPPPPPPARTPRIGPDGLPVGTPRTPASVPLRDLHDVVEIPDPWRHAPRAATAALALGVGAVGIWLWMRRRQAAMANAVPENPADVARRRLDAARGHASDPRMFGIEVSAAIREYLESRYGLRAPDQTTEEFLADLRSRPLLETRHQGALAAFLEQCDLLKFAGARPGPGMTELLLDSGRRVVDETDPGPRANAAAEGPR